jgi:hypothetical protein
MLLALIAAPLSIPSVANKDSADDSTWTGRLTLAAATHDEANVHEMADDLKDCTKGRSCPQGCHFERCDQDCDSSCDRFSKWSCDKSCDSSCGCVEYLSPPPPSAPPPQVTPACEACQLVSFDFSKDSPPSVQTLQAKEDGEIRYKGIGTYGTQTLDLVVTRTPNGGSTCSGTAGKAITKACMPEKADYYGGVNVGMTLTHKLSGTISLRDTHSNQLVVVPMFCLTWVDLDGDETIEILGYGDTFTGYAAGDNVLVENTVRGFPYPSDERNAKKFTRNGKKANIDNTHTNTMPLAMDEGQRAIAFEVYFTHTSSFDFIFYDTAKGSQARSVWFTGTSNFYQKCPKLVPAPPPSSLPGATKTCIVVADPVVNTFTGYECMVSKVGAYPVLVKGDFQIQTFHCPNNAHVGTSNVVGMAVSDGDNVLEIVGEAVSLNGKVMSEAIPYTEKGAFSITRKANGQGVVVIGGKFLKLTSERRTNDKLSPGYDQKLVITVPADLVDRINLEHECMCAATAGSSSVEPLTQKETLFSTKSLTYVQSLCGVPSLESLFAAAELAKRARERGEYDNSAKNAITGSTELLNLPAC